jgi:hypothetical protein
MERMTYDEKLKAALAKTTAPTFKDAVKLGAQTIKKLG